MAGKDVTFDPDFITKFLFVRELLVNVKEQLVATDLNYDAAIAYIQKANANQKDETAQDINGQIIEALQIAKELQPRLEASSLVSSNFDAMVNAEDNGVQ
jgi:hypothetical protein